MRCELCSCGAVELLRTDIPWRIAWRSRCKATHTHTHTDLVHTRATRATAQISRSTTGEPLATPTHIQSGILTNLCAALEHNDVCNEAIVPLFGKDAQHIPLCPPSHSSFIAVHLAPEKRSSPRPRSIENMRTCSCDKFTFSGWQQRVEERERKEGGEPEDNRKHRTGQVDRYGRET